MILSLKKPSYCSVVHIQNKSARNVVTARRPPACIKHCTFCMTLQTYETCGDENAITVTTGELADSAMNVGECVALIIIILFPSTCLGSCNKKHERELARTHYKNVQHVQFF